MTKKYYVQGKLNKRDRWTFVRVSSKATALRQAKQIRAVGGYAKAILK